MWTPPLSTWVWLDNVDIHRGLGWSARLQRVSVTDQRSRIVQAHQAAEATGVGVSVPATSANLGPGYDSFGVALDIPLVAACGARQDQRVVARGEGAGELPDGDDNLVWRAVLAWCGFAGTAPPDVSIHVDSAIPLERGLGSSSAAAVAGLLLGRALTGGSATITQLLGLATDLEGHADNAAAALVGGLVACTPDGLFDRFEPSPALRPIALVPTQRQSTAVARAALPTQVSLGAAAANIAHATSTFAGLTGLVPLRTAAMVDLLHEPVRLPLMPTSRALVEGLRAADVPAALSGAGPTVLAVIPDSDADVAARVRHVVRQVAVQPDQLEVVTTAWQLGGATVCPPGATLGPAD